MLRGFLDEALAKRINLPVYTRHKSLRVSVTIQWTRLVERIIGVYRLIIVSITPVILTVKFYDITVHFLCVFGDLKTLAAHCSYSSALSGFRITIVTVLSTVRFISSSM